MNKHSSLVPVVLTVLSLRHQHGVTYYTYSIKLQWCW